MFSSGRRINVSWATGTMAWGVVGTLALCLSCVVVAAQGNRNWDGQRFTRLDPGMTITVRTAEPIDTTRTDYRVYNGVVEEDVRGDNGRLAIPRGSAVELIARRARNNEMVLDLESVNVNGQRYAIQTDPKPIVGTSGLDSLVGSIIGAIRDGNVRGPAVRIPRDTVLSFRLDRTLDMGVADRGVNRDGYHYHDYYDAGRR
jgi:hypothetical protein